jgi:hypothetical protein
VSTPPEREPAGHEPAEWDQAAIANELAATQERARRRRVVKKRRKNLARPWEYGASEAAPDPAPAGDDEVIESLERALREERFKRERSTGGRQRGSGRGGGRGVGAWFWATGCLVAVLAVAAVLAVVARTNPGAVVVPPRRPALGTAVIDGAAIDDLATSDPLQGLEILESGSPAFDAARACLTGFFTAPTPAEKLRFVRPTPGVEAHLEAMARHPMMTLVLEPTFGERFIRSGDFIYAEVVEAGVGFRGAVVEETPEGARVDFDSLIGYSDADWEAIVNHRLAAPVETRAVARLLPDIPTGPSGDSTFEIWDPAQSFSGRAVLNLFEVEDERLRRILTAPSLLPYIFELSPETAPGGEPLTRVTRVVATGWFGEAIFPWMAGGGRDEGDSPPAPGAGALPAEKELRETAPENGVSR